MKIHLLAIDLDGTLLNSAKQITQTTAGILRTARQMAGVQVVLASARPPRSVMPFHTLLELDTPMINYNGALVYEPSSRRVVMHRPIPVTTARTIVSLAREAMPEVVVSAEVLDRWFTDRVSEAYLTETAALWKPDTVAPIGQWLNEPVTKLLLLGEPQRLSELAELINRRLPHQVVIVRMEPTLLQVMHATVSKAAALRTVAAELRVDRENVMAIGDNANDVGMLQWAGIGVAMGNAAPEAIAVADYVTDHHDADGAAKAVHELIIRGDAGTGQGLLKRRPE
jgi:Cof subfamily protein (haloacid dehalogenase superfamily)